RLARALRSVALRSTTPEDETRKSLRPPCEWLRQGCLDGEGDTTRVRESPGIALASNGPRCHPARAIRDEKYRTNRVPMRVGEEITRIGASRGRGDPTRNAARMRCHRTHQTKRTPAKPQNHSTPSTFGASGTLEGVITA